MDLQIEMCIERNEANQFPYKVISEPKEVKPAKLPGLAHARFEPCVSLVVAVGAVIIVERIVDHWLTSKEQGVLIDFRNGETRVSRIAGMPAKVAIIAHEDGTKEEIDHRRSDIKEVLVAMFENGGRNE